MYRIFALILPFIITGVMIGAYFALVADVQTEIDETNITQLYIRAEHFIEKGDFEQAREFYSEIIQRDATEEKAWHEKGKLLNRFEMCLEALDHYVEYVELFPDSSRAAEGLDIARHC